jgi:nucleotide-binding universal stress UspA family protein
MGVVVVGVDHSDGATAALRFALEETLRDVGADTDGVTIERRVDQGAAAAALVEESRGADLLVVGSRGHGGFAQLLLGSVSQQSAQHAFCPVVIVRDTEKNGHEGVS